jgi:hypothetical protein
MTRYLISIYQPDGTSPGPEVMDRVGRDLHVLNEELKAAGSWGFTAGSTPRARLRWSACRTVMWSSHRQPQGSSRLPRGRYLADPTAWNWKGLTSRMSPNKVTGQARHLLSAPGRGSCWSSTRRWKAVGFAPQKVGRCCVTRCCTDETSPYTTSSDQTPY